MQIPFGEWLPDQPEHGMKGANVATNVYHALGSYLFGDVATPIINYLLIT